MESLHHSPNETLNMPATRSEYWGVKAIGAFVALATLLMPACSGEDVANGPIAKNGAPVVLEKTPEELPTIIPTSPDGVYQVSTVWAKPCVIIPQDPSRKFYKLELDVPICPHDLSISKDPHPIYDQSFR